MRRDTKGLYQSQRNGELTNLAGADLRYEAPEAAVDTSLMSLTEAREIVLAAIIRR